MTGIDYEALGQVACSVFFEIPTDDGYFEVIDIEAVESWGNSARAVVAALRDQGLVVVPKRALLELFIDYGEIKRQIGEQQGQIQYIRGYSDVLRRTHQHISDLEEQARHIAVAIDAALAAPGDGGEQT